MLAAYLETVEARRKHLIVYGDPAETDLADQLATRNVTVEHRRLPPVDAPPFVTIHDEEGFVGALTLEDVQQLLDPPVIRPGSWDGIRDSYRTILSVLEETLFATLSRRQLLATTREFEDRAYRIGTGTLSVTFQSLSVFTDQADLYRTLGEETALDIHVYGRPDWDPPLLEGVTYHPDHTGSLSPFWCVAFDGGGDTTQACVLIAREATDGYVGCWSYDPEFTQDVLASLEEGGM